MKTAWLLAGLLLLATADPARAYMAYVTNERDNTISVVDLDQMRTVKTVPVGQRPRGITMTADGNTILVCASDDDTIQIIDTQDAARHRRSAVGPRSRNLRPARLRQSALCVE